MGLLHGHHQHPGHGRQHRAQGKDGGVDALDRHTEGLRHLGILLGHTGDGGPIPPTNKETNTHYVYILSMNDDNKIAKMQKVWNAPWALNELGWT